MSHINAKNELNEFYQARHVAEMPAYASAREGGADHVPRFRAAVSHSLWEGRSYGGYGSTKKEAELAAARAAVAGEASVRPPPPRDGWVNPDPGRASRVVLVDLENQHGALGYEPRDREYIVGFIHEGGAAAVRTGTARFPIERVAVDAPDAADAGLIWHLAELVLARGLPRSAPVLIVSTDHIFATLASVLRGRGLDVRCVAFIDAGML